MNTIKRTLISTPMALVITTGLGLLMAGLIKAEYVPATDEPQYLSFTISEPIIDIPITERKSLKLTRVTPPPPVPKIDIKRTGMPDADTFSIAETLPKFRAPGLMMVPVEFKQADTGVQPILRPLPVMPTRFMQGNHSGRCHVRFDVSPQGSPYNVVASSCTAFILERGTVKSVLKWKFRPKTQDGQPVAMHGVENDVVFRLLDEHGQLLPEI